LSAVLVAVTVIVCELKIVDGAVYTPADVMLPGAPVLNDHVTAGLLVPVTVAVNGCDCPAVRLAEDGATVTPIPLPAPKNNPLRTGLPPPKFVTWTFTCPLSFHTRYAPFAKLGRF